MHLSNGKNFYYLSARARAPSFFFIHFRLLMKVEKKNNTQGFFFVLSIVNEKIHTHTYITVPKTSGRDVGPE